MTKIVVIVAIAQNSAIGKNNEIPWHIKEDFQHFKDKTLGFPCIMGERTYESLPENFRPLPGRENIVLSFNKEYHPKGTVVFNDFNKAIEYVKNKGEKKAFIIGGATIYKLGMHVADVFELTRIYHDYDADTFYPPIDFNEWQLENREDHEATDIKNKMKVKLSFLTYIRKK